MKLREIRWYVTAGLVGLFVAAYGNPIVNESFPTGTSMTNCPTYYQCNVPDHLTSTVAPCCCSLGGYGCQNYQIDQWVCAAGGTLYANFRAYMNPYSAPITCTNPLGTPAGCH